MLVKLIRILTRFFWLLPGFLLWASFPPMGETADCLFALAPLLWLARNADQRTNLRRWFANGMLFWVATLSWMPAIVKNGGPWPLVVLGWGCLAAYCALFFALFGWLACTYWTWVRERPSAYWRRLVGLLVVEPVLWAGLELIRSRFLGGFAWNQLGVIPANAGSGFGVPAALGGVYVLSAVVVLLNGTIASIAERMLAPFFAARQARMKMRLGEHEVDVLRPAPETISVPSWLRSVETVLPFLLIFALYGAAGRFASRGVSREVLNVALVQRNFPCCFKAGEEHPLETYDALLKHVSPLNPELVVLCESAMAEFGAIDGLHARSFARRVMGATGARGVLAGGTRFEEGRTFNSAALYQTSSVSRAGMDVQAYDKVHLVPFGEFIPGDKLFPALQKLAPVGSCTPGELRLLSLAAKPGVHGEIPFGVGICFEDTDSAQTRALARKGARFLAFITNDSWFSHSIEAEQHAWQATARAIETGLAVVRVGNSGVSGVIAPDGRRTWLLDANGYPLVDARGTMFDRLPLASGDMTPYARLGDVPLFVAFLLLILVLIMIKYTSYGKRRALSL